MTDSYFFYVVDKLSERVYPVGVFQDVLEGKRESIHKIYSVCEDVGHGKVAWFAEVLTWKKQLLFAPIDTA